MRVDPAPLFPAFHALAVDDGGGRTCFPSALLAALDVEGVMHAIQSAIPTPQVEIVEQRTARRQVLRNRSPLAARAQNVHDPVHDLTDVNAAFVSPALGRWNQWLDIRPLVVSQIAWTPQCSPVTAPPVFPLSPSVASPESGHHP